jgi:hypothetical protein
MLTHRVVSDEGFHAYGTSNFFFFFFFFMIGAFYDIERTFFDASGLLSFPWTFRCYFASSFLLLLQKWGLCARELGVWERKTSITARLCKAWT